MDKTTNNVKKTYTLPIVKMSQEGNNLFDARYLLKDKNLGKEQDMSPTLDRDLRKYFGFGKRSFKSIVKKPGNKLGFKLSSYIAPTDSISTVNEILLSIAQHREYIKSSPVKEVFNRKFKEELRANFYQRHPKKYLITLQSGNVRHHPLMFYAFNKHIYLIVHQECIKSIAETCKDAIDSRSFKKPMR